MSQGLKFSPESRQPSIRVMKKYYYASTLNKGEQQRTPYRQELPIPKDVETRDSSIPNKPKSQMQLKFAGVQRRNLGLQSNLDTNLSITASK